MKRNYEKQMTMVTLAAFLICFIFAGIAVAEDAIGVQVKKKLGVGNYLADGKQKNKIYFGGRFIKSRERFPEAQHILHTSTQTKAPPKSSGRAFVNVH